MDHYTKWGYIMRGFYWAGTAGFWTLMVGLGVAHAYRDHGWVGFVGLGLFLGSAWGYGYAERRRYG